MLPVVVLVAVVSLLAGLIVGFLVGVAAATGYYNPNYEDDRVIVLATKNPASSPESDHKI